MSSGGGSVFIKRGTRRAMGSWKSEKKPFEKGRVTGNGLEKGREGKGKLVRKKKKDELLENEESW